MTIRTTELFRMLSCGELSNLAIGNDGAGTIRDRDKPKILLYANDALKRLYGRFVLREQDLLLELYDHITSYHLLPRFAWNYEAPSGETPEPFRYIRDLPAEPFTGDVMRIMTVFSNEGQRLPLNDDRHPLSLFTPQANVLQVPRPENHMMLSVAYQAKHAQLTGADDENVYVPDVLYGALTAYIAYKVYSHMNTQESTAKAQEHLALYEALCLEVQGNDLVSNSVVTSNTSFQRGGWI